MMFVAIDYTAPFLVFVLIAGVLALTIPIVSIWMD